MCKLHVIWYIYRNIPYITCGYTEPSEVIMCYCAISISTTLGYSLQVKKIDNFCGYVIYTCYRWLRVCKSSLSVSTTSVNMMTSSNENIFRVTGPLCGEFTGHRWIPRTKASDAELWCCLWSACEQTVEWTIDTLVIWDAIAFIISHTNES